MHIYIYMAENIKIIFIYWKVRILLLWTFMKKFGLYICSVYFRHTERSAYHLFYVGIYFLSKDRKMKLHSLHFADEHTVM